MVAAARSRRRVVLVGSRRALLRAALLYGIDAEQFGVYEGSASRRLSILDSGPQLKDADMRPGKPGKKAGVSQLLAVEEAFALAKREGVPMVTGPVSKAAIARCGLWRAANFRGHTEWLEKLDGAPYSVMCFASRKLNTSLVTTHLPISRVARAITPDRVHRATVELARLLQFKGTVKPRIAVASLNPHAGEAKLLGGEEASAIAVGVRTARRELRSGAILQGPLGAETAYRQAFAGQFDGVVAMYHDQATIPMKLVSFGDAVNVTMGLSVIRTSVDHGTAYDIAGQGCADPGGMASALRLAGTLHRQARAKLQG